MVRHAACAVCRSPADRMVAGYLPLCAGCARAMWRTAGVCSRCYRSLRQIPNYAIRGRLYCGECAEVIRRIQSSLVPEAIGLFRDEQDRQAEITAWLCILESLLETDHA